MKVDGEGIKIGDISGGGKTSAVVGRSASMILGMAGSKIS